MQYCRVIQLIEARQIVTYLAFIGLNDKNIFPLKSALTFKTIST